MAENCENQVHIEDIPVTLRRKGPGQVWTARINLPTNGKDGGRVERSTKTSNVTTAIGKAHQIYGELRHRVEDRGESATAPKFEAVLTEFTQHCDELVSKKKMKAWRRDRLEITLRRHYLPFFEGDRIDGIGTREIKKHREWRQSKPDVGLNRVFHYTRGKQTIKSSRKEVAPTIETERKERQDFRAFLDFCESRGYISDQSVIRWPMLKGGGNRRKQFKKQQMLELQKISIERILETKHTRKRYAKWQCHMRMMWIYLTGCRPQEIAKLQQKDLKKFNEADTDVEGNSSVRIMLSEKHLKNKRHERTIVPLPGFDDVYDLTLWPNTSHPDNDYVFKTPEGKLATGADKTFRRLLQATGIIDGDLSGYSLYSLRHTFITERLYEGIEIGKLSRWCGTSVAMIERHYDHMPSEKEMEKREIKPFSPIIVPIPHDVQKGMDELLPFLVDTDDGQKMITEEKTRKDKWDTAADIKRFRESVEELEWDFK